MRVFAILFAIILFDAGGGQVSNGVAKMCANDPSGEVLREPSTGQYRFTVVWRIRNCGAVYGEFRVQSEGVDDCGYAEQSIIRAIAGGDSYDFLLYFWSSTNSPPLSICTYEALLKNGNVFETVGYGWVREWPTLMPTAMPTPRLTPFPTNIPTPLPTTPPTTVPTLTPTKVPTQVPTVIPTSEPTQVPTPSPSSSPTDHPSPLPTQTPTGVPTCMPTPMSTVPPTTFLSLTPTDEQTPLPTESSTKVPTYIPSPSETFSPTATPSSSPSQAPTFVTTSILTGEPTSMPTWVPSAAPTKAPTSAPNVDTSPPYTPTEAPVSTPVPTAITSESQDSIGSHSSDPGVLNHFVMLLKDNMLLLSFLALLVATLAAAYFISCRMEASRKAEKKRRLNSAYTEAIESAKADDTSAKEDPEQVLADGMKEVDASNGRHIHIFLIGLACVDLLMDIVFVVQRFHEDRDGDLIRTLSAVFLILPLVANCCFVFFLLRLEFKSQNMRDWFQKHSFIGSVGVVLAFGNPEFLSIFVSQAFGCFDVGSRLNAPLSRNGMKMLLFGGLVNNFLEDIPQLVLQGIVLGKDGISFIPMVAAATSGVMLLVVVVRRLLLNMIFNQEERDEEINNLRKKLQRQRVELIAIDGGGKERRLRLIEASDSEASVVIAGDAERCGHAHVAARVGASGSAPSTNLDARASIVVSNEEKSELKDTSLLGLTSVESLCGCGQNVQSSEPVQSSREEELVTWEDFVSSINSGDIDSDAEEEQ